MLFPAFAHAYLNLVALGAQAEAQALMGAHRQRFLDAAVGGSTLRMQVGGGAGSAAQGMRPALEASRRTGLAWGSVYREPRVGLGQLLQCSLWAVGSSEGTHIVGMQYHVRALVALCPCWCLAAGTLPESRSPGRQRAMLSLDRLGSLPHYWPLLAPPHRPSTCPQELQDLASIPSAEAIGSSRTAAALRQRRLSIRLCRASYDLLTHFLQLPRQLVILSIVNEHIKFEARLPF